MLLNGSIIYNKSTLSLYAVIKSMSTLRDATNKHPITYIPANVLDNII